MTGGKLVSSGYNPEETSQISYLPTHLDATSLRAEKNGKLTSVAAVELETTLFAIQNISFCIMNPVGPIVFIRQTAK
jgi:hypothetical protein